MRRALGAKPNPRRLINLKRSLLLLQPPFIFFSCLFSLSLSLARAAKMRLGRNVKFMPFESFFLSFLSTDLYLYSYVVHLYTYKYVFLRLKLQPSTAVRWSVSRQPTSFPTYYTHKIVVFCAEKHRLSIIRQQRHYSHRVYSFHENSTDAPVSCSVCNRR